MKDSSNIMALKAAQPSGRAAPMGPDIALQRALYKAAHLGLGLPVDITGASSATQARDGVLSDVRSDDLIIKLEQDFGAPGVMALDIDLVAALVEVQTLGNVQENSASARPFTNTDAAVAMPLIDGTMSGFEALLPRPESHELPGFHFGAWVRDRHLLAAQLPDGDYQTFELSLGIGSRDRRGRLFLAVPEPPEPAPEEAEADDEAVAQRIQQEIMDAPARLETVLYRMEMTLGDVSALKEGDLITMPLRALSHVTLHAGERKAVATGILGQLSGQRAVCLKNCGLGAQKAPPTPAEQADSLAKVDLADPGLIGAMHNEAPVGDPLLPDPVQHSENADDILRELGIVESSAVAGAGEIADMGLKTEGLPAISSVPRPGIDDS